MKLCRSFLSISISALLSLQVVNANQNILTEEFKNSFISSFQPEFKNGCVASTMAQGVPERKREAVINFCSCVAEQSKSMLIDEVILDLTRNMKNPVYMQQLTLKLLEKAAPKCM